ncbi:hypothetical protein TeGR_g11137 [Tetraparma gracilis]|uniref:MIP18 family-like domain-containing protein n=1 Tax=Tetraparma gracilis TaxID=2962635 RepID=A0ABQ6N7C9_9STRA|nr:hypothetical protein TeGR_g11137 [Tetraparma gracilis]
MDLTPDPSEPDPLTAAEVFAIVKNITDPEHPLTLSELSVVQESLISITDSAVTVSYTPTIPHCSMATLIGLCLKTKCLRSLPSRYYVDVHITPGTHASEHAVNKQLADKERVAAAMENEHLAGVVNTCISGGAQ